MWKGFTPAERAEAYERYLREELFPHLKATIADAGFMGYHILRRPAGSETEFITMAWFRSLEAVKSFAGEGFERAVISEKAATLLSRWERLAVHYDLADSSMQ
jgi:antibiotic biosynthesis monooxygenase (ABM) superfamily enzyme